MTKAVSYKQSNRLTQGVFHKCPILPVFLLGVPRTFGQDCRLSDFHNWNVREYLTELRVFFLELH